MIEERNDVLLSYLLEHMYYFPTLHKNNYVVKW